MTSLAAYLADRNAATLAWVAEDPANRWAGTYTEDLAHWASMGVLTARDLMRYEMETQYSDLYKDVYGVRPRGVNFSAMSYEDLSEETAHLMREMEQQAAYEAEYQARQAEIEAEQETERLAWLAEQPEKIDYVACRYQEGWL